MVSRRHLLKLSALGTASFAAPLAYSASNITMTHNTGNPIGSTSPKDLSDNSRNLDYLSLGPNPSYPDRKGVPRKSWSGMEGEYKAGQIRRESEFADDQAIRAEQFDRFMESSGYTLVGDYDSGPLIIERYNQFVMKDGQPYRLSSLARIPYTTTGNWAAESDAFVLLGDDVLRQDLASQSKGASIINYMWRSVRDKLDDFISITDFYRDGDGGQWHQAYTRAAAISSRIRFPFRHDVEYIIGVPLDMPSGSFVLCDSGVVLRSPPAIDAKGSHVKSIINTVGKKRIGLVGVRLDGGVREVMTGKSYTRPARFIDCEDIACFDFEVVNNPDWALSFEHCDGVRVTQYKQRSYVYSDPALTVQRAGGRDGLHFMDCRNAHAYDLDIESGDDCVGVTSRDSGSFNISIKGVRGTSVIAGLVIYNEEHIGDGAEYAAMPLEGLAIDDVQTKYGATVRNVVRVVKYNSGSTIKKVSVTGVRGKSTNHGISLAGIDELHVDDTNVISMLQHGAYINGCKGVTGAVRGKSISAGFDGVQINGGSDMNLIVSSTDAANYGMHLIALQDSIVVPMTRNCGAASFESASGGNGRMVNCKNVEIPNGVLKGDDSISYFGLIESGNTNCRVGRGVQAAGFVSRSGSQSPVSVYQEPAAAIRFKEEISGGLTVSSTYNCSVVRESLGVYRITFDVAMRSTTFNFQLFAQAVGSVRNVKLSSNPTVSEIVITTVNSSGEPSRSDIVSLLAYDS